MRGWLAALLCCWAAMGEDEYNCEKKDTKGKSPEQHDASRLTLDQRNYRVHPYIMNNQHSWR